MTGRLVRDKPVARLLVLLLCASVTLLPQSAAPTPAEAENAAIRGFEVEIEHSNYASICAQLESYTQAHPESWRALYQLGYLYLQIHEVRKSLATLSKSLVLNDRFPDAHKTLAFDLNILGRQDLATIELKRAIQLDPNSFESHYELGRILFEQAYYRDAIEQFQKAKTLAPEFVKTYHNLGLAYAAVGENANAVAEFRKALELNSKTSKRSAWPYIDFGTYYNLQGDFENAKQMLLQAIQIDGVWDQAYSELAKAYRGLGQTPDAIDNLKRAIAINPKKPEYHYSLAVLYRKTSQTAEATQQMKEYEECKTTPLSK